MGISGKKWSKKEQVGFLWVYECGMLWIKLGFFFTAKKKERLM